MSQTVLADFRLPRRIRRTLGPLARVVCTDEIEQLGLTETVLDHVELTMRAIPTFLRAGLLAGTTAFELGAAALPSSRGRTFSRLPPDLQEAYFKSWWGSPVFAMRQFAKGIKGILAMGYWEHPVVKKRMEFHPDAWIAQVAARRLRDYADDIRDQDRMVLERDPLVPAASLTRKVRDDQAA